jgi:hypothetical protein
MPIFVIYPNFKFEVEAKDSNEAENKAYEQLRKLAFIDSFDFEMEEVEK